MSPAELLDKEFGELMQDDFSRDETLSEEAKMYAFASSRDLRREENLLL